MTMDELPRQLRARLNFALQSLIDRSSPGRGWNKALVETRRILHSDHNPRLAFQFNVS